MDHGPTAFVVQPVADKVAGSEFVGRYRGIPVLWEPLSRLPPAPTPHPASRCPRCRNWGVPSAPGCIQEPEQVDLGRLIAEIRIRNPAPLALACSVMQQDWWHKS